MELALHRLRMLRELARRGSMTAAAGALHYTTSGVSQQLAALETEVGVPLLERIGRGVRLTEIGRVLAAYAEEILEAEERAKAALEEAQETVTGELAVGVFAAVAATLVPPLLSHLATRYPAIRVSTCEIDPEDAVAAVRHGDLDLAFLVDYPDAPEPWQAGLRLAPVGNDLLHLAAAAGRYPTSTPTELAEFADVPWVISGSHTYYGRVIRSACRQAGFEPQVTHQIDEQAPALAMVAAGLGVTLVSDLGRTFCPPNVDVIALTHPLRRRIILAHRPTALRRPALRAFLTSARRAASDLGLVDEAR